MSQRIKVLLFIIAYFRLDLSANFAKQATEKWHIANGVDMAWEIGYIYSAFPTLIPID